jgi:putative FmdB family regulatory protein
MPTYEYRCPKGHESEDFVLKMSDAKTEIPCPECGAPAPRRVSGGSGLHFKGTGFYITDYGKDGKKDQKPPASKSTPDASPSK